MPDWAAFVRERLQLPAVCPERQIEIVEDLARQLDDSYRDALASGVQESAARSIAERHITNWAALSKEICHAEVQKMTQLTQWQQRAEERDTKKSGRLSWLSDLRHDVMYGLRMLRKTPGVTAVALLSLALGIGANTAIFSLIQSALLREPPYPNSNQLVMVWEDTHLLHYQSSEDTPAPGNYADWKAQSDVFTDIAALDDRTFSLTGAGEPDRIDGEAFSAGVIPTLNVFPFLGRAFTSDEDRPGAAHVAILSYGLWVSRFGSDREIIGHAIHLNDASYTVVGVMPRGFRFPDPGDQIWVPLALTEKQLADHGDHYLRVIARLKPGVSVAQAHSELRAIAQRLTAQYPDSNTGVSVNIVPLHEQLSGDLRSPLLVLAGVVAFILLMVCANLANLLLARASVRAREFAVRLAIGASRARIIRQLLAESLLLAVIGGTLGLVLAYFGIAGIHRFVEGAQSTSDGASSAQFAGAGINFGVCAVTLGISLVAGFLFGLVPAFQSSRREIGDVLNETARKSSGGGRVRARGILIMAEVALGAVVLISAGLLLRSFISLQSIPLGFEAEKVLTFRVILPDPRYESMERRAAFYKQATERLQALPGVRSAAAISYLPLTSHGHITGIGVEGQANSALGESPVAAYRAITPGYFLTMRIPLLQGRDFSAEDSPRSPLVAIVSETMAHNFWPGADATGRRFKLDAPDANVPWITVVGVAGNVRQLELTGIPGPAIYFPATQDPGTGDTIRDWMIRSSGDPAALAASVRSAIDSVDPTLPVSRIQTLESIRSDVLGPQQFNLALVGLFGMLALILAAVGLYGVTSYSVVQRTHEIGIRVALGARPRDVLRLVVGQGARLAVFGLAIGICAALALAKVMASLLYGIGPRDPITFGAVALLLLFVALAASYIPARRAARVDPLVALRHE
jgi:putative ABC transport system permease protein